VSATRELNNSCFITAPPPLHYPHSASETAASSIFTGTVQWRAAAAAAEVARDMLEQLRFRKKCTSARFSGYSCLTWESSQLGA